MSKLPTHHPIRVLRRNRRPIAAALAAGSLLLAVQAFRPAATPTSPVVIASHDLAAGSTLSADDLGVAQVPTQLLPQASVADPHELLGSVTAVAVAANEPVSPARLLARELALDPKAPGNQPMPIRIADADAAALLRPGNRINLIAARSPGMDTGQYAADPTAGPLDADVAAGLSSQAGTAAAGGEIADLVADNVLVLARIQTAGELSGTASGTLVLVSVTPQQAIALAAAQSAGRITFTVAQ